MNRKDAHLFNALKQPSTANSFDEIHLIPHSISNLNIDEIDITTQICGYELSCPFFINAMTGGSEASKNINAKLAEIAQRCDLMIASGSYSAAILDSNVRDSFDIIKQKYPKAIYATNIGIDKPLHFMETAIKNTNANILQIHLNLLQELVMPEGERNFKYWEQHLKIALQTIKTPIIVKEVGFGMSQKTIEKLINCGAKTIDISGKGGTNFALIENERRTIPITYLNDLGISTVNSLLNSIPYQNQCDIIASGGVRNPLDIIKCLVLGAKAVGISKTILTLIHTHSIDEVVIIINNWKHEIKMLMCLLNAQNIEALKNTQYYLTDNTYLFYQQLTKKQ